MLKSSFYQSLLKTKQEEAELLFPSSLASFYRQALTQVTALHDTLLSSFSPLASLSYPFSLSLPHPTTAPFWVVGLQSG
jgi:hypothetical protein